MSDVFHEGELAVQARAGVSDQAQRVGRIIQPTLPEGAAMFLANLPMLFQGGVDGRGDVWASVLAGQAGFIRAAGPREVVIDALLRSDDPLAGLEAGADAGFLAIELSTRRRFRFNGKLTRADGELHVRVEQAYGNCPKYIQVRELIGVQKPSPARLTVVDTRLSGLDIELIRRSDTFFIASTARGYGADVSHRGGLPGFVRASADGTLVFKDYPGNNMFQTLGNLTIDPRAGLLFIDFESGTMLQLTGKAEVRWPGGQSHDRADKGREVVFRPRRVIRSPRALGLRWVLRENSPFNPEEK